MSDPAPPEKPIVVRDNPAKEITESAVRAVFMAGFAIAAGRFIQSETVMGAIQPLLFCAAGYGATWFFALRKLIKDHRQRRFMARRLPNTDAVVR